MSFDNEQLKAATDALWDQYAACITDVSASDEMFSPDFLHKMKKMRRKYRMQQMVKTVSRWAAMILATLIVTGGLLLGFHSDAQAAFQRWFLDTTEEGFLYRFFTGNSADELGIYEITWLPEDYIWTVRATDKNRYYTGHRESYLQTVGLHYYHAKDDSSLVIQPDPHTRLEHEKVTVNRQIADFYTFAPTGSNGASYNLLVWVDEETGTVFSINSNFLKETMIRMAESVQLINP